MQYKKLANKTLVILIVTLIGLWGMKVFFTPGKWIDFAVFVVEAALIGGIADWFAVTALFTYPLGIKLPHTALIPNNRKKVISSFVHLIQHELLSEKTLKTTVLESKLIYYGIKYIDQHIEEFIHVLVEWTLRKIKGIEQKKLSQKLEKYLKIQLKKLSLSSALLQFEPYIQKHEIYERLWDQLIDFMVKELPQTTLKKQIYHYLWKLKEEQATKYTGVQGFFRRAVITIAEQTNTLNLTDATDVIYNEIVNGLIGMKEKNHPIRIEIEEHILELLQELKTNSSWQTQVEDWQNKFIDEIDLSTPIEELLGTLDSQSQPINWVRNQLFELWMQFKENELLQYKLEKYLKEFFIIFIEKEHQRIGKIVEDVLETFTDEDLVQFIEEKVGEDLQWIRINGSIVGSIVGAVLYIFLYYIYEPLLSLF